ncbi:MAG: hypothetical protein HUJ98_12305, partial [Bacteroidaceae bacterium]|nr:hypothetical protein [Bacteroidaceae bacterium]
MKKIYYMPALLAGMLSLASCNDNEPNGGDKPANPQDAINFNIGQKSASSRTHYAANDWLQIEWDSNDQITIACAQTQAPTSDGKWASKKSANYTVTQVLPNTQKINIDGVEKEVTTNSKAKIAVKDGETALYWGQNNPDSSPRLHTFYAGYGEGITIDDEGVAKCMYDAEQVLVKDANNVWINMKQAYMVAHTEPMTPTDEVSLKFKPIMTTLEVEIQAPSTPIKIKAMEITVPKSQDKIDVIASSQAPTNAYFKYDIAWKSETGETTGKVLPASSPTDEKIIFTLDNTQEVSAGGSIKITAILPPIEISETDKLLITVDATDISNTATFASSVATSAKAVIKSGAWKGPKDAQENVDYVDLDLPSGLKWATCNLGASNPKEYGDYYGWGCTIPYATSADAGTSTNCPLYFKKIGGTGTSLSHCQQGKELDPLTGLESISGTEYDAAHVRLGGKWRMPTQAEVYELMKNCDWVKETQGNEKYWKISSKTNPSKFIYLPLGGRREGYTHSGLASGGQYWNSTPSSENDYNACRIW